ncbi:hypothetical protein SAMN05428945_6252 [Streptomyces sp. 2224.1]|nr:hypothetical protein BX261_6286 [Streptomyces sp. 2321.6]SDQ92605.1 hypothetical protein SAMN05216511_0967 [Streptomyces sp. KS_16]SED76318.1 hypothetical protein SAMN05428954_0943 [Streptomyces sp. 2112.3]SED91539.1 hypothetical protein SAMN05428940_6312 [Streptomyces sp. 2133.1]SED97688.1 hypothetical protein SAMN05428945_6252 [Streptomyces sp. 2224.1]SNC73092.1 hypothetical protein SAMN06272741_6212 [Streptomyces sp. 2114.4]
MSITELVSKYGAMGAILVSSLAAMLTVLLDLRAERTRELIDLLKRWRTKRKRL